MNRAPIPPSTPTRFRKRRPIPSGPPRRWPGRTASPGSSASTPAWPTTARSKVRTASAACADPLCEVLKVWRLDCGGNARYRDAVGGKSAKRRSRSQPADILKAAAPFLKKRGTGAPVDQIMKATGLTSGALYSQFKNKDDLCTQAICGALDATLDSYRAAIRQHGKDGLRLIVERYLSDSQRGDVAGGCTFAALGGDMAKAGPRSRRSYQHRIH